MHFVLAFALCGLAVHVAGGSVETRSAGPLAAEAESSALNAGGGAAHLVHIRP